MKRKILICFIVMGLAVGTASAQLGSGIVYDPTNYQNALLRYYQLQQHLAAIAQALAFLELVNKSNRFARQIDDELMPALGDEPSAIRAVSLAQGVGVLLHESLRQSHC